MSKKKQKNKTSYHALISFFIFLLAFSLRYEGMFKDSLLSLLIVLGMFTVGILVLAKSTTKLPKRALMSLGVIYLLSFVDVSSGINIVVLNLGQLLLFALFGMTMLRIYNIKLEYDFKSIKKISIIFGVSLLFAYIFLLLNEPFPSYIKNSILILLAYTFLVSLSEELVFRGASFSLLKTYFSQEKAVHVQAVVFTIIHLISINLLYDFYILQGGSLLVNGAIANLLLYAIALYCFAVIAARYAKGKKNSNIVYPIFFHWLVNFINLVVILFI